MGKITVYDFVKPFLENIGFLFSEEDYPAEFKWERSKSYTQENTNCISISIGFCGDIYGRGVFQISFDTFNALLSKIEQKPSLNFDDYSNAIITSIFDDFFCDVKLKLNEINVNLEFSVIEMVSGINLNLFLGRTNGSSQSKWIIPIMTKTGEIKFQLCVEANAFFDFNFIRNYDNDRDFEKGWYNIETALRGRLTKIDEKKLTSFLNGISENNKRHLLMKKVLEILNNISKDNSSNFRNSVAENNFYKVAVSGEFCKNLNITIVNKKFNKELIYKEGFDEKSNFTISFNGEDIEIGIKGANENYSENFRELAFQFLAIFNYRYWNIINSTFFANLKYENEGKLSKLINASILNSKEEEERNKIFNNALDDF